MDYYDIGSLSPLHDVIIGMYFAFTTLSTVGLGDFVPRSNSERFICSLVLLIGVGVFSVFLGNLSEILEKYKAIN